MSPTTGTLAHGDILTAISDGLVALLKEYYGRGPTEAKSYFQDDLVVCVLRGGFSRVEQTLLDGGRSEAVILQRMAFQDVMRDQFTGVIASGQDTLLTVGRIRDRVVVRGRALEARPTLFATLNVDHRTLDGADAAKLLDRFATAVERPEGWERTP